MQIIRRYNWIEEYFDDIEVIVKSTNYLLRISVIPVVLEYDLRMGTSLGSILKNDSIVNVRDYYSDYTKMKNIKPVCDELSTVSEDSQVDQSSLHEERKDIYE